MTAAHLAEMDKYTKFSEKEVEKHYDEIAINYEGVYLKAGYPDPEKAVEAAVKVAEKNYVTREFAQIVDFGCGSGLVG